MIASIQTRSKAIFGENAIIFLPVLILNQAFLVINFKEN